MKNTMFRKIIAVLAVLIGAGSAAAYIFMNMGESTIVPALLIMVGSIVIKAALRKLIIR